jgi:hypothetical protein
MNAIQRVAKLETLLKQYSDPESGARGPSLSDVIENLGSWSQQAERTLGVAQRLRAGGIAPAPAKELAELALKARKFVERLEDDWSTCKLGGHYKALHDKLPATLAMQKSEMLASWTEFCEDEAGQGHSPTVLAKIRRFREVAERIQQAREEIEALKSTLPPDQETIEIVRTAGARIRELEAQLDFSVFSKRVRKFLASVGAGRPQTAAIFTDPELVAELDEHGLLDEFIVSPK